jgi:hypothetical protein
MRPLRNDTPHTWSNSGSAVLAVADCCGENPFSTPLSSRFPSREASREGIPAEGGARRESRARAIVPVAIGLVMTTAAHAQSGGGFDLTWSTIDGGGAMFSTGGGYELGGTIGQPDANTVVMTGGSFSLEGGFWFPGILCSSPAQDADGDGDVDLADFLAFQACFNGPNRAYAAGGDPAKCACLDTEPDADVDLADFLVFQGCFNGPNRPPACP